MKNQPDSDRMNSMEKEVQKQQEAAATAAVKQSALLLTKGAAHKAQQLGSHVRESPNPIKVVVLICGITLLASSIMLCFNVLNVVLSPFSYVLLAFNMLFSLMIILAEGPSAWAWFGLRDFFFAHLGFMRYPLGRCFFYLYVGATVFSQGSSWIYYGLGAVMLVCAILQLVVLAVEKCQRKQKDPLVLPGNRNTE